VFELDLRSRKPIYEQLIDHIKDAVLYGILAPDEQLPSVRMLSSQLVVNPNTVQKAYRELEREGYIYSLPGKGSFISPRKERANPAALGELRSELMKLMTQAVQLGLSESDILRLYRDAQREERSEPHD
jgi:GntR family transcriptional regulator